MLKALLLAITLIAAGSMPAPAAEVGVGVDVGPGHDRGMHRGERDTTVIERDRPADRTIIEKERPRDRSVVIKKRRECE